MGRTSDLVLEWLSLRLPFAGGVAHRKVLKDNLEKGDIKTVLDVGCGRGTFEVYKQFDSTGVDIFPASVEASKKNGNYKEVLLCDVRNLPFEKKSFDAVSCNEVIEHLDKPDGWNLLDRLESIARKRVIIMTPWGLDILPKRKDNPYLDHQSGWYPEEFSRRGYKIIPFMSIRWRWGNAFWQLMLAYGLSIVLRPLIWMYPEKFCNDFAAVKDMDKE